MNKSKFRWGCLFAGLLILILLGGGWWYIRLQSSASNSSSSSSSSLLVFIISPASEEEMEAGDFVPVTVRAVAPEAIQSVELFVDGQYLGVVTDSPLNASWTWQAWPLGIHSFYAQATTASGQIGYSQVVVVNVLAGDGSMQVVAGEGQTLEQIGSGYGVPPDQMAGANPKVDPSQPLPGGKQVQVPIGGAGSGSGFGGSGNGGQVFDPIYTIITWTFKPKEPVNKSYCYTSMGNGVWEKIPKPPFNFLDELNSYIQLKLTFPNKKNVIQAQCWGWLAGVLKYLGQGETQFDVIQPPGEVKIDGSGFVLTGIPKVPPIKEDQFLDNEIKAVPPPFALREPKDSQECKAHGNLIITPYICENLMNAKVKQHIILEWEWAPKVCWPGSCPWYDKVDGYRVYEYDPFTHTKKLVRDEKSQGNKVTAVPLPWGAKCYQVEAYVNEPGVPSSVAATHCPGDKKYGKMITLSPPAEWLTTEHVDKAGDDCVYTQEYVLHGGSPGSLPGFGTQVGEVFVGEGIFDKEASTGIEACYMDEFYQGGIKFNMTTQIPINAVIQKAILRFTSNLWAYRDGGDVATPAPGTCASTIRAANQDWSAMVDADHWVKGLFPYSGSPISLTGYGAPQVDVTSIVANWIKKPSSNHGFILSGGYPALPTVEDSSICVSTLSNFQLDIYYFASP